MKYLNFFLITCLVAISGCQTQEEEELDEMALAEEELDTSRILGPPIPSPQEILFKESPSIE